MDELLELNKHIIETLDRLEKAGTLKKFFAEQKAKPLGDMDVMPYIGKDCGYKEIKEACYLQAGHYISKMADYLGKAKSYLEHIDKLYMSYDENRSSIENPMLLKFLDDYDKDHEKEQNKTLEKAKKIGYYDK